MRSLGQIAKSERLSSLIKPGGSTLPLGESIEIALDATQLVKKHGGTNYHPCGTCPMIPEKMGGVVDDRLKAYGSTNLRVVDAWVFPIIPRGNIISIISTVYAVAVGQLTS
jgi:choline dehydrogenase-like flavoprotein